jgi:hypothetical protein
VVVYHEMKNPPLRALCSAKPVAEGLPEHKDCTQTLSHGF